MPDSPKLLSIPKAAKEIGAPLEDVRAWTKRQRDPLPTVAFGRGKQRPHRKVVMPEVDSWLARNSKGESA